MRKVVNLFKHIFSLEQNKQDSPKNVHQATVIPRNEHCISRKNISPAALKVLYQLHNSGFAAYLVGGSVRDLLLGQIPKDFDVVTDALPEQIQKLFRYSYIIGRRFRLVHVRFGREVIEVATFRGNTSNGSGRVQTQQGLLLRDNVYGSLEDDVWRRDFTVNALYYNIADFTVVDFTEGMEDLKKRSIRVIGHPDERYREDPARMLRAIRLASKLDFQVENNSSETIKQHRNLLHQIPPARLFDKMLKIFYSGKSLATFRMLQEYDVFCILFPQVSASLIEPMYKSFIEAALENTDERVNSDKGINAAFLFAVFLWCPIQLSKQTYLQDNLTEYQATALAINDAISEQLKIISISRKLTTIMREIWQLQYHLEHARSKRVYKILFHPRFRAAYDFLLLRVEAGESSVEPLFQWWTIFQAADDEEREKLIKSRFEKNKRKRKRNKRGKNESLYRSGEQSTEPKESD